MDIAWNELSSAFFGGFSAEDFARKFMNIFNGAIISTANFLAGVDKWLSRNVGNAWNFFREWFKDDPVGATAGAILGVIVLVIGGKIIGGAVGGIWALLKGGIASKLAGVTLIGAIGKLIQWTVRGTTYLYNFNWNVKDEDIAAQQKALVDSMYSQFGEWTGTLAGTLVCGTAPVEIAKRTKIVKTNPMVLAKLQEISEGPLWGGETPELYDELIQQTKALIQFGAQQLRTWAFLESYKNIRKWIKQGSENVNLRGIFPGLANLIDRWGEDEPWSFAIATENFIESIDDSRLRNFTEEAIEAFMDSCTESLMIVSYAF